MEQRARAAMAVLGAVGFFLIVQFGAMALAEPFRAAGYQSVEDPQNPVNSVLYLGVILVATVIMLGLMRYDQTTILRLFLVGTSGLIVGYVASVAVPAVTVGAGGGLNISPWIVGGIVVLGLLVYPEWWVIDGAGLLMGIGAAALFGISFGILPAILLLSALAIYDAISVYGTEHMLTLASGVMDLRVPVLVIIPTTMSYSFIDDAPSVPPDEDADGAHDDDDPDEDDGTSNPSDTERDESGGTGVTDDTDATEFERDAIFIGLGDAVMPSILVASATVFLDTPRFLGVELAPLTTIVGTTVGLLVLLSMVMRGRAHAGLPLLNGGAILGYLLGALASGLSLSVALGIDAVL